jgi:tRNA(Ile)-lysidine synthase
MPATRRPPPVARVLERIIVTARKHEMFLPGQTVLVCVSGGADSVCLLESLIRLRRLFRIRLEVFHFDHRLRADSAKDAAYVKRLAERHRLPFHLRLAESRPAKGESIESWARDQRRIWSANVARDAGAARIAVGHTMDDQAETILLALVRGWGLSGLAGIRPVLGKDVQPLLDVRRQEVEASCRALGLRPRRDPTNRDPRYLRNALRHRVIPALERATDRELTPTFARTAALLRADSDLLSRQSEEIANELIDESPDGCSLPAAALLTLPGAIATRVVRRAFTLADIGWTEESIDAVLDLAAGRSGRTRDLVLGSTARRDREYVHLSRPSPRDDGMDPPRPGKGKP